MTTRGGVAKLLSGEEKNFASSNSPSPSSYDMRLTGAANMSSLLVGLGSGSLDLVDWLFLRSFLGKVCGSFLGVVGEVENSLAELYDSVLFG